MNNTCFNHLDQTAVGQCIQCGKPICAECRQDVAGRSVCSSCVDSIRARIETQLDQAPAIGAYGTPAGATAIQSTHHNIYATPALNTSGFAHRAATLPAMRLFLGVAAAVLVGVVGAVIWEKIVYYSHFNIGYLTALIGYGVGYALVWGSGRRGLMPAIIGGVIAFLAQMLGYILLFNAEIARDYPQMGPIPASVMIRMLPHSIDIIGWIIVAVGTYLGFKTPMNAQRK